MIIRQMAISDNKKSTIFTRIHNLTLSSFLREKFQETTLGKSQTEFKEVDWSTFGDTSSRTGYWRGCDWGSLPSRSCFALR